MAVLDVEAGMARSLVIQGWRRWTLVALLALVSLNAIAAGYAFVTEPSGAALGIPQEWLEASPFDDYQIPGAILVALGILYAFAAVQEVRRARSAWFWAGLSGGAMIVWIIVQVAMMGYDRHPIQTALQAFIMIAGLAIGIIALGQLRSARAEGRAA